MANLNGNAVYDRLALLDSDSPERVSMIEFIAPTLGMTFEQLETAIDQRRENAEKRVASEKAKVERQVRNTAIEAVSAEIEVSGLTDELFEKVSDLGGQVVVSSFVDGEANFTVSGLKVATRGGGNGKGRPKKDTPQPYADANGDRILGGITDWSRANLSDSELESFVDDEGKLKDSGTKLAKALIEAGHISEFPLS